MSTLRPRFTGCLCFQCVGTANVGVVERCGKFQTFAQPGFNFLCWPLDTIAGGVSLRLQQLNVLCDTKTRDNVFLRIGVSVQYEANKDSVYDAYYKLTNPQQQINSYVYDSIRSTVPKMELDAVFTAKDEIAHVVKEHISKIMEDYGYKLFEALVIEIDPDIKVKQAMNEINASKRLKEAEREKAEANKITLVKAAEADAESKYLSGFGVAKQRRAIVDGLRDSVVEFSENVDGTSPQDVMHLLLLTQFFDMLNDVGSKSSSQIFIPHSPNAVAELKEQLASFGGRKGSTGMFGR